MPHIQVPLCLAPQWLGTEGLIIIDGDGKEVVRMGTYYGSGWTNNEAEMFAARDCMAVLAKLSKKMHNYYYRSGSLRSASL